MVPAPRREQLVQKYRELSDTLPAQEAGPEKAARSAAAARGPTPPPAAADPADYRQRIALWKLPFIARHARALMARDIHRIPLFTGVSAALAQLATDGATLAIVTSNSRDNVLRVLGEATASLIRELECGVSIFGKASKLRRD